MKYMYTCVVGAIANAHHISTHTYVHTYMYTHYIHTCIHTCTHTYLYIHVHTHTPVSLLDSTDLAGCWAASKVVRWTAASLAESISTLMSKKWPNLLLKDDWVEIISFTLNNFQLTTQNLNDFVAKFLVHKYEHVQIISTCIYIHVHVWVKKQEEGSY